MRLKFVFLALVCVLVLFLCLYPRGANAETLDNDKEYILETFGLPAQVSFDHCVSLGTFFIVVFAFILFPQQFLIQFIGRHENSPPSIYPVVAF